MTCVSTREEGLLGGGVAFLAMPGSVASQRAFDKFSVKSKSDDVWANPSVSCKWADFSSDFANDFQRSEKYPMSISNRGLVLLRGSRLTCRRATVILFRAVGGESATRRGQFPRGCRQQTDSRAPLLR